MAALVKIFEFVHFKKDIHTDVRSETRFMSFIITRKNIDLHFPLFKCILNVNLILKTIVFA